ncbi:MAG: hypothetical protein IJC95_06485, partial [Clostridia bacterium]|nr:hypothetical protein [Clostridia bacterium]
MNRYKKYYIMRLILSTLFGVGLGVLLIFLAPYAREVFDILVIAMGLLTAVLNLPALFFAVKSIRCRGDGLNLFMTLASILLGIALMLLQTEFLLLLLGVYSVVLPLLRIILVENHMMRAKREIPRFLVGLIMVVIYLLDAETHVLWFGAFVSFAVSLIYLIYGLISAHFIF